MKTFQKLLLIPALLFIGLAASGDTPETDTPLPRAQIRSSKGGSAVYRDGVLHLRIDDPYADPAISLLPPQGQKFFDFSHGRNFVVDVTNLSKKRQGRFLIFLKTPDRNKKTGTFNAGISLNPGETRTLRFALPHRWLYQGPAGLPGVRTIDTSRITSIDFALHGWFEPELPGLTDCLLSNMRLEGELTPAPKASRAHIPNYFPFIDRYGQFVHADWPEKIRSDADLKAAFEKEKAELAASPRPAEWNEYGGWKNGPQLKATGSFRTEKYNGKWYLIDPCGRLFFSHGIDVLWKYTDPVKVSDHEHWFAADVRGRQLWQATDDVLKIKYGKEDYSNEFYRTLAKRLEHWGINTIGDWGADELAVMGKMPYTFQLTDFDHSMPSLGHKFYDVYDPAYREKMKNLVKTASDRSPAVRKSLNDPMCIGYWIDNELFFGNRQGFPFAGHVMSAPATKAAKREFVSDMKRKYGSIDSLNRAWNASYTSFDALLASQLVPACEGFRKDMEAFFARTVEEYFRICRDAVKSVAPHRLYLGCRFLGDDATLPVMANACAKYADVLSANIYRHTPGNFRIEGMPDIPVLIGEFHFSTSLPGRGVFTPDIVAGADEHERATTYLRYLQGALVHPNIVGTHWFQLRDQPLTGRFDGEGYQIGFLDIADTPYREMTETARDIGENMYQYRLNGKYCNEMK